MWVIITLSAMIVCASYEILGTRVVVSDQDYGPLKLRITTIFMELFLAMIIFAFGFGESGLSPFSLIMYHPLIAVSATISVLKMFLYLIGLRYIGLTIQESLSGASGILLFIEMLGINLISGKLSVVKEMLIPSKLVIVLILFVSAFVLPNLKEHTEHENNQKEKHSKQRMIRGLFITFVALIFDSLDSLTTAVVFADESVGTLDFMMSAYIVAAIWGLVLYLWLYKETKVLFQPLSRENRKELLYGVLSLLYLGLYLYGVYLAPVQSNILWIAYPVLPIVGCATILKERYSFKQYLCIGVITLSSILFCLIDK